MAKQLHKRFSDGEVKMLLEKYLSEKVELSYLLEILGIKRRRFFGLLKEYKRNPARFSIQYERKRTTRKISKDVEKNIINLAPYPSTSGGFPHPRDSFLLLCR